MKLRHGLFVAVLPLVVFGPLASAATPTASATPPATAAAVAVPAGGPALNTSVHMDHPRALVTATGNGFGPGGSVDVYFDARQVASGTATSSGAYSLVFRVPSTARPGSHTVTATRPGGPAVSRPFVVNTNWRTFGFDAQHTGTNPYENVLGPASAPGLKVVWSTDGAPPAGETDGLASGVAVVDGVVYTGFAADRNNEIDAGVAAVDAQTGAVQWRTIIDSNTGVESPPTVAAGVVYVADVAGRVVALDATTGQFLWADNLAGDGSTYSPELVNGLLYVAPRDLYALDPATGAVVWQSQNLDVANAPAVANGIVYATSTPTGVPGVLYAFDAVTGAQDWSVAGLTGGVAVDSGLLLVGGGDGRLHALSPQDGSPVWTSPQVTPGPVFLLPTAAAGQVYVEVPAPDGNDAVDAIDETTGALLWSQLSANGGAPVTVANGVVYVQGDGLTTLDPQSGAVLSTLSPGGGGGGPAAVVNGNVYFAGVLGLEDAQ